MAKEESLQSMNINIGILGHPRSNYDIILCPISSSHSSKDDDNEDDKDNNWQTRKSSTNENMKKKSVSNQLNKK